MTSCEECQAAETNPLHGVYLSTCNGCAARSMAHGQDYFYARESDSMTPQYRSRLQEHFGSEWVQAHQQVREWADKIESAKLRDRDTESA